jgi:hypothetical protein
MDLALEFTGYDGGITEPDGEYSEWHCPAAGGVKGFLSGLMRMLKGNG